MKFETPKIKIERFDMENIVTTSVVSTAAQSLASELAVTATSGVNVVNWALYSE